MAEDQVKRQKERHPSSVNSRSFEVNVGDNVFIMQDKSKLRGRELYKIIKRFQEDNEEWAIICKCENKFMSKEYKVKLTELMPAFSITETTNKKPDDKISDDDSYTNDYDDRPYTQKSRPPTRKAAIKARRNWNEQQTSVRTCTDQSKIHAITHHGWSYDDWLKYVEDEPYEHVQDILSYPHVPVMEQHNDPSSILDELERELTRYCERVDLSTHTEEDHIKGLVQLLLGC